MPMYPQAGGQRCKGRPKNTLFVLPLCFWAKEKGRFFEAGAANPCQLKTATPVTLLLCFGVYDKKRCETPWSFGVVVGVDGGI